MTAHDLGMKMMLVPMSKLPPLALGYANKLCRDLGVCSEVLLAAWTAYAHHVEGLPCDDDIPGAGIWFAENRGRRWELVNGQPIASEIEADVPLLPRRPDSSAS